MSRKKILKVSIVALSVLLLLVGVRLVIFLVNRVDYQTPDTSDWQSGYIFFSVGDSWKSDAVRSMTALSGQAATDSTPSHCGFVLMGPDGPLLVHESTTEKQIVAQTPMEFITREGAYCVYALPVKDALDTVKLRRDIEQMLEAATPFDFNFDHNDTTALYCSELVVTLFEKNGRDDLTPLRQEQYIYPRHILEYIRAPGM